MFSKNRFNLRGGPLMERSIYDRIVQTIDEADFDHQKCLQTLKDRFPDVKHVTLESIVSQEHTKRVKRTYSHQTSAPKRKEAYRSYKKLRGGISEVAERNRFSATLTARCVLAEHLKESRGEDTPNKNFITAALKDSSLVEDDPHLAEEIWKATLKDENYGVLAESAKSAVGNDYEARLKRRLRALGFSYKDEHDLRAEGYDKTPDVKLDVPFAVNGSIVNWIESKALFGDDDNHSTYLKEQLWSYWNRFGPGLVIYWHGYLRHLEWGAEHGILVRDSFPADNEIIQFEPEKEYSRLLDTFLDDEPSDEESDEGNLV